MIKTLSLKNYTLSKSALVFVLFILSFALRLAFLSKGPFHLDALELAIAAEDTIRLGKVHYLHGTGYPLTSIIASAFFFLLNKFH